VYYTVLFFLLESQAQAPPALAAGHSHITRNVTHRVEKIGDEATSSYDEAYGALEDLSDSESSYYDDGTFCTQALNFVEIPVSLPVPARRICHGAQGQPFPEEYNMYATI
jgi:hypothetical protein